MIVMLKSDSGVDCAIERAEAVQAAGPRVVCA